MRGRLTTSTEGGKAQHTSMGSTITRSALSIKLLFCTPSVAQDSSINKYHLIQSAVGTESKVRVAGDTQPQQTVAPNAQDIFER